MLSIWVGLVNFTMAPPGREMLWLIEKSAYKEKTEITPREKTDGIKQASSFPSVCHIHLNIYLEQIHSNEFSVKVKSTH